MERRKQLRKYIQRAKTSLSLEKITPIAQYGLFFALLASASLVLVSRFFVWPYYRQTAIAVFVIGILATIAFMWWKLAKEREAMHALDSYFSHNELVTALSFKNDDDPLVQSLLGKAVQKAEDAFIQFKARKKNWLRPTALIGFFATTIVLALLYMFPAATQIEAVEIEKKKQLWKMSKKKWLS